MKIPEKHHHAQQAAAAQAIAELKAIAESGNREAVEALRNIALGAISALDSIDLGEVPRHSQRWPVALNAIKGIREGDLSRFSALSVGAEMGINIGSKSRDYGYDNQAGFALDVYFLIQTVRKNSARYISYLERHPKTERKWQDMAAILPDLTDGSLKDWQKVGMAFFSELCMGDFSNFIWPQCVNDYAEFHPSPKESAVKEKLRAGLKSLCQ